MSIHGQKNFPFRKEASDLDVELPDGCGDADYLTALEHALDELDRRFTPGLVIYLAGADPFERDRLGRLSLSFDGLEARDRRVFDYAWQRRVPLAFAMAGGYARDISETVKVQLGTFKVASTITGAGTMPRDERTAEYRGSPMTARPQPEPRSRYRAFRSIPTRWADNDVYGHVNNVVYYGWFDTAVNALLIERGALDIHHGSTVGLVVENAVQLFRAPSHFRRRWRRVSASHLSAGPASATRSGLFAQGAELAAAQGHFIHVYVDRSTRRPVALPSELQRVLEALHVPAAK